MGNLVSPAATYCRTKHDWISFKFTTESVLLLFSKRLTTFIMYMNTSGSLQCPLF